MLKSVFTLIFFALANPCFADDQAAAQAAPGPEAKATLEVVKCGVTLPELTDFDYEGLSVLAATVQALDAAAGSTVEKAKDEKALAIAKQAKEYELEISDNAEEIVAIGGLGKERSCSGSVVKAWGWNGAVDGQDLMVSATQVADLGPGSRISWTYGYVLLKLEAGKTCEDRAAVRAAWKNADPLGYTFVQATAADCSAKD